MIPDTISQLILWLLAPASVGAVISWLMEKWPRFQELPSGWKAALFPLLAVIFGGLAGLINLGLEGMPANTVELLNVGYAAGMTAILILLGSQAWHEWYNQARKRMDRLPELLKAAGADETLITLSKVLLAALKAYEGLAETTPPLDIEEAPPA